MDIPEDLRYAESHEWIQFKPGGACALGITDHAQAELSDVVFVELPEVECTVNKGESIAVVESVKAASDIYAPVSGKVVEVNTALNSSPELINTSPYKDGWILKIKPSAEGDFDDLHDAESYADTIG